MDLPLNVSHHFSNAADTSTSFESQDLRAKITRASSDELVRRPGCGGFRLNFHPPPPPCSN